MTPQQSKSRADIGERLAHEVDVATAHPSEDAPPMVVEALIEARVSLHFQGFREDSHWLGEHMARADHHDLLALTRLALRFVERLHIATGPVVEAAPASTVTRAHHDTVVIAMAERIARLESLLELAQAKKEQATARPTCHHPYSMYGQCVDCGMTWSARAEATGAAVQA
ncbi:hypothetical protein ACFWPK_34375 [Nocardia sp. NPDC058519]|uniref:hypothetical protein n=1 Tax=Nocardia sp. NPDC058519 TaxID=3346535 RepID=UPI00364EB8FB